MALLLGIDTGGTYTDAVVLDDAADRIISKAKALTTRPDLARGVGAAMDRVLEGIEPARIGMVSLSTTLATNALVEGQGGRAALVLIGFGPAELEKAGLAEALGADPVIYVAGGHSHAGSEAAALDTDVLDRAIAKLPAGIGSFAVAARFATRNPAHETAARDLIRARTGLPVTCSHELSAALGGPKRALTALLNARLIGLIARLMDAVAGHMTARAITAPLMIVRGDGALVSADWARERPIETILSGPAASIAGAAWLTGLKDALVSDIGGTTTDVCLLQDGRPKIDPEGAKVGAFRTMVEAVAMRTTGLGGDSAVTLAEGLNGGLVLGPRRMLPVSLLAVDHPALVHTALDRALSQEAPGQEAGQFVLPLWAASAPAGLDKREAALAARLSDGPARYADVVRTHLERPALGRMVARGEVIVAAVTPSDAAHMLGLVADWDGQAAEKALTLFSRRRDAAGQRLAPDADTMARRIVDQVAAQTVDCLLEAAFAEEGRDFGHPAAALARHPLTRAGLDGHAGILRMQTALAVPVIGLGASARSYYGPAGFRLGTRLHVPTHADVANAIGAVVGQVEMQASGQVTATGPGKYVAHLSAGPAAFADPSAALAALEAALKDTALHHADAAGVMAPRIVVERDVQEAEVEGQRLFVSASLTVRARGRPRIAER